MKLEELVFTVPRGVSTVYVDIRTSIDLTKLPAMTLGEFAEFLKNRGIPDGILGDSGGV